MKKQKKSLVAYGNKYATGMVFHQHYSVMYPRSVSIPLLFEEPKAECKIKVRITIEEI